MKSLRALLVAVLLLTSGSALAYETFTVGLQAEAHRNYFGYNAHAVLPFTTFTGGTNDRTFSVRADFTAGDVVYAGLAAVISGAGPGIQPFASLGAGAALWGAPPRPTFQGLIGARVPVTGGLYAVAQFQLLVSTLGHAEPGFGIGLEYSF